MRVRAPYHRVKPYTHVIYNRVRKLRKVNIGYHIATEVISNVSLVDELLLCTVLLTLQCITYTYTRRIRSPMHSSANDIRP